MFLHDEVLGVSVGGSNLFLEDFLSGQFCQSFCSLRSSGGCDAEDWDVRSDFETMLLEIMFFKAVKSYNVVELVSKADLLHGGYKPFSVVVMRSLKMENKQYFYHFNINLL